MPDIRQTLKLESDPSTNVFPNIKKENIPSLAIDSTKIENGAVIAAKIANGAVQSSHISPGAVGTAAIENLAVTSSKIANGAVLSSKIAYFDSYIIDEDLGDDIDEFVTMFTRLFKRGYRFYFDDESGYICNVDSIEIGPHSVTLYCKYPLQGMTDEQIINSSNFDTYFTPGNLGSMLHYCGA